MISPRRSSIALPPSVTWSMPMPNLDRYGRAESCRRQVPPIARAAATGGGRLESSPASARSRSICRPDNTPSNRGCLPKLEIGGAGELVALLFRAVLKFELLHQSRRRGRLDLAARPATAGYGLRRRALHAGTRCRPAARGSSVPSNFGSATGKRERAIGLDAERVADRVDIEMHFELRRRRR